MKLSVIALDYDGTITQRDGVDPAVREAIAEARTRGILVMLVTGRILLGEERPLQRTPWRQLCECV
ncbi:MAG: HAD hydrolase family protein [Acidobacteria bacterium]|nr:HAD hydrolase family protein [Acidobacteriota bacterium]